MSIKTKHSDSETVEVVSAAIFGLKRKQTKSTQNETLPKLPVGSQNTNLGAL